MLEGIYYLAYYRYLRETGIGKEVARYLTRQHLAKGDLELRKTPYNSKEKHAS